MGWKLSKIDDPNAVTSHDKRSSTKDVKKNNKTFRDVGSEILQNSILGSRFNNKRRLGTKKHSIADSKDPLDSVSQSMLGSNPNQIINLQAPTQFNKDYNKGSSNNIHQNNIKNSRSDLSGISPQKSKRRRKPVKQRIRVDAKHNKTAYMPDSTYFGSRLQEKIAEFNKLNANLSPMYRSDQERMTGLPTNIDS
jgi:hypothetical protein